MPTEPEHSPGGRAIHTRTITCRSVERGDGLWDVEASLEDRKHYDVQMLEGQPVPADTAYHSIRVRLTVDDALRVTDVEGQMRATPFAECAAAPAALQDLVGLTLGRGWRKAVEAALDRQHGCTHMREMLSMVPSAAIQAIPGYRAYRAGQRWPPAFAADAPTPHFIGGCIAWRQDGAVVLRHYPQFHQRYRIQEQDHGNRDS